MLALNNARRRRGKYSYLAGGSGRGECKVLDTSLLRY